MNKVLSLSWFPSKNVLAMATVITPRGLILDMFASKTHTKWSAYPCTRGHGECEIDIMITNLLDWNHVLDLMPLATLLVEGQSKCLVLFDVLIRHYRINWRNISAYHVGPLGLN